MSDELSSFKIFGSRAHKMLNQELENWSILIFGYLKMGKFSILEGCRMLIFQCDHRDKLRFIARRQVSC